MTPFDHVTTLLSFVYALALAHLLSRVGALILARERVGFSGLQALVMVNAVVQVFLSWLAVWNARGVIEANLPNIAIGFVYAITVYFICAAAAPDVGEGPIDLEAFYWRNRVVFYGLYLLSDLAALATGFSLLKAPERGAFFASELATLPFFVPCLLAIAVPTRWAQWASGLALLAVSIAWLVLFSSVLR